MHNFFGFNQLFLYLIKKKQKNICLFKADEGLFLFLGLEVAGR
jgi:hypothetical protein